MRRPANQRCMLRRMLAALLLPVLAAAASVCTAAAGEETVTLKLSSPAFTDGGAIPQKYTCEGEDISPPLAWSGVPAGAKSLVLIVDDPDAPDPKAPKMTWVHWVLYNLPGGVRVAFPKGSNRTPFLGKRWPASPIGSARLMAVRARQ